MMLAGDTVETPRPRPPAKIRRSASLLKTASTPPPSYAAAFSPEGEPPLDTLLGSPMSATFQRVGWSLGVADRQLSATPEEGREWMNRKSREELTELLVKADDLIKERENELETASAVCKSLYDNNVSLKNKHQTLLNRLPSKSPSSSPELVPHSRYSISLNLPASEYDSSPLPYKGRARKVSVSTADISHLADQNVELLDKLERIESESLSADQSGRRTLKRLEKEISDLRTELEKTQAKSEELEEKAKAGFLWDAERANLELERKKQEREARVQVLRNLGRRSNSPSDEGEPEIKNFAPEGSTFGGPSSKFSFFPPRDNVRKSSGIPINPLPPASASLTLHPESSLIAQLLEKIQELEDTNARIIDQQTDTKNQLEVMQRETDHISRIYECFTDENLIELASDAGSEGSEGRSLRDETIRFRSFKRNLEPYLPPSPSKNSIRQSLNISSISKMRKSVVGLFDSVEESQGSTLSQLRTTNPLEPFPLSPHSDGYRISPTGLASPAPSSISISSIQTRPLDSSGSSHRTLESELRNEFSDGWDLGTAHDHPRTSSLYDISQSSAPPSPSPSQMSHNRPWSRNSSQERETLPTPMSLGNPALQLSIEPPTSGRALPARHHQETSEKRSLRYHRMSETVRSRTNRWVDGRFNDTLIGKTKVESPVETNSRRNVSRPLTPLSLRLASAFDATVLSFTGEGTSPTSDNEAVVRQVAPKLKGKKPRGLGAIMLEVWLWLQFAIILLVFLWAMARRGPKSVLVETGHGRRRTISSSSSLR